LVACVAGAADGRVAADIWSNRSDGCFAPIIDPDSRALVQLGLLEAPAGVLVQPAQVCWGAGGDVTDGSSDMPPCFAEFPFIDRPFALGSPCY
jgi:hypothetical protein